MKNVLMILVSFISVTTGAFTKEENIELKGISLFSFTPSHYILQGDKYVYKINKSALSSTLQEKMENSSANGKYMVITIPKASVEYLWMSPEQNTTNYKKMIQKINQEAKEHKGQLTLVGKVAFSFADDFYLIQVNEDVYQIKKANLGKDVHDLIARAGVGGQVNIVLPSQSVNLVWSYRVAPARSTASVTRFEDKAILKNENLEIKGTVLLSQDEPLVLIQSENTLFQLERAKLSSEYKKYLDNPGSRIEISAPIAAVKFVWEYAPGELVFKTP